MNSKFAILDSNCFVFANDLRSENFGSAPIATNGKNAISWFCWRTHYIFVCENDKSPPYVEVHCNWAENIRFHCFPFLASHNLLPITMFVFLLVENSPYARVARVEYLYDSYLLRAWDGWLENFYQYPIPVCFIVFAEYDTRVPRRICNNNAVNKWQT